MATAKTKKKPDKKKALPSPALTGSGVVSRDEYLEPHYRVIVDWTPALLKQALRTADAGNLRTAADLCDAILGDDRAPAVLGTRVGALLGSDLEFEASGGRRKKRALKALEAEEDWWQAFPEDELGQLLTWGILLGVGLGELVWTDDPTTGRLIPRLKVWHPRHLRYDYQTRQWMVRVEGETEVVVKPGDGKWILFMPYGSSRPWAHGLWRGMSALWLLKDYARRDFGLVQEIHGQPMMVGKAPTPALRQELAATLRDLGRSSVFAIPADTDLKAVEMSSRNWEMFTAQIEIADRGFSILAIGTNLPTEVTAGVGTGATAQDLVRQDYKRRDAEMVATTLRQQALVWWAEFNFGNSNLAPWPKWMVEPPEDLKATAGVWLTVAQALTTANPDKVFDVDLKEVEEVFKIKLVAAEKVKPPAPVVGGDPGGEDGGDMPTDGNDMPADNKKPSDEDMPMKPAKKAKAKPEDEEDKRPDA